jgi:hypothetical protein
MASSKAQAAGRDRGTNPKKSPGHEAGADQGQTEGDGQKVTQTPPRQ